jgi:hypothetical protein
MIARDSADCRASLASRSSLAKRRCDDPTHDNITRCQVQVAGFRALYVNKRTFIYLTNLCIAIAVGRPHFRYAGDEKNGAASMKMFLTGVALAAALASPAVAQSANHHTVPGARYAQNGQHGYVYPSDNHAHSSNPANDVYDIRGRYIGSDPDPFIRDYLARGHSRD